MFSRFNVRTKLLVMMTPAVAGLCVLAVLGLQTRLDDRSDAQRARNASALTSVATTFVHELQQERVIAATAAAAPSSLPAGALDDQAARTDRAATDMIAVIEANNITTLDAADGIDVVAEARLLAGQPDTLGQIRSVLDGTTPQSATEYSELVAEVTTNYTRTIEGSMSSIARIETGAGGARPSAMSRQWLGEGIEAESAAAATAANLFIDTPVDPGDGEVPVNLDEFAVTANAAQETRDLTNQAEQFFDTYGEYAGDAGIERLSDARDAAGFEASSDAFDQLASVDSALLFDVAPEEWPDVANARLRDLVTVETSSYRSDIAGLTSAADRASSIATMFAAGAAATCLLVMLLGFVVSRGITGPLRRLAQSAREISKDQIPSMVLSLRSTDVSMAKLRFTEVDTRTRDEFADVAEALNDLGRATLDVATEQHLSMRKGISDIFVNLARRNQTLLDRQIQFIDRLESNEEDPDQLENLFKLDHLATRMRRNAESLLVLAGAEAPRRRARDVSLTDVIRVAVGEVEDFARIWLVAIDDADAAGNAAVDIAHLLAELMENGAQHSPTERTVDVSGHRSSDGGYVISITDHGVGMALDRMDEANSLLASPPPVGLALSRALGFVVAGTLANRHKIMVRLATSPSGGVTAEVTLPPALVSDSKQPAPALPPVPACPAAPTVTIVATEHGWNADGDYVEGIAHPLSASMTAIDLTVGLTPYETTATEAAFEPGAFEPADYAEPAGEPAAIDPPPYDPSTVWGDEFISHSDSPTKLRDAIPEGPAFDIGLYALLDRQAPLDPSSAEPPATGADDSGSSSSPDSLPQRPAGTGSSDPFFSADDALTAAPTRAPEEVRGLLARYRSGLVNGHADGLPDPTGDDQEPSSND